MCSFLVLELVPPSEGGKQSWYNFEEQELIEHCFISFRVFFLPDNSPADKLSGDRNCVKQRQSEIHFVCNWFLNVSLGIISRKLCIRNLQITSSWCRCIQNWGINCSVFINLVISESLKFDFGHFDISTINNI